MSGGARPVVLVVIDGWGVNSDAFGNAIAAADTPVMDMLLASGATTTVAASGEAVGLPPGQQGNSEVGHLTIGAGRIVLQDLPRISRAIEDGSFDENAELVAALERARDGGGTLHVIGLVSPGGVHSHQDHGVAMVRLARSRGVERLAVHAITDGRDEPPTSAADYVETFEAALSDVGHPGGVASVSGRYYAMDRDRRWDRIERAYSMLTGTGGDTVGDAVEHIRASYERELTDEFIEPVAVVREGEERARIVAGDTVVVFNFRPDRARQLCHALVDDDFDGFDRGARLGDLCLTTFTEYESGLTSHVAFPKATVRETLAEVVASNGLRQFHVAETEKYAHVTYFINGGREPPFEGEERILVPSPKAATYDTCPTMSAVAITDRVVERIGGGADALIVVNFANPDMVGHTGDLEATVEAVTCVDGCIGRIVEALDATDGALLVTADHGNAEHKVDARDNSPLTAHTTAPVPVILRGVGAGPMRDGGGLADVAPTTLGLLGLDVPSAMTGRDLRDGAGAEG